MTRPLRMIVSRSDSACASDRMWLLSRTVPPLVAVGPRTYSAERRVHQRVQARRSARRAAAARRRRPARDERDLLPVALGVGAALLASGRARTRSISSARRARVQAAAQAAQQVDDLAAGEVRPQARRRRARRPAAGAARRRRAQGSPPEQPDLPASARSSPSRMRRVVVLPAPLGPRKPWTSPRSTCRSRPSRATVAPKRFTRPEMSITGAPSRGAGDPAGDVAVAIPRTYACSGAGRRS